MREMQHIEAASYSQYREERRSAALRTRRNASFPLHLRRNDRKAAAGGSAAPQRRCGLAVSVMSFLTASPAPVNVDNPFSHLHRRAWLAHRSAYRLWRAARENNGCGVACAAAGGCGVAMVALWPLFNVAVACDDGGSIAFNQKKPLK
jgi:hypothetical protein